MLNGESIGKSFKDAKEFTRINNENRNFEICCCSHDHTLDCKWLKYFDKHGFAACEMHSHKCKSKLCQADDKGIIQHSNSCPAFSKFKAKMFEIINDFNAEEKAKKEEEKKVE